MSGEVVPFPAAPRLVEAAARPRLSPGDMVVTCINDTLGLWCAWPVALVDDDGVVLATRNAAGRLIGIDRLNCRADVYGFRAADHRRSPFLDLRWKTWGDPAAAVLAFAEIGAMSTP